jgi:hypothetical protein
MKKFKNISSIAVIKQRIVEDRNFPEDFFEPIIKEFQLSGSVKADADIKRLVPLLSKVPFFQHSCPSDMTLFDFTANCLPQLQYESFPQSAIVFHKGEAGDKFYIILQGNLDIYVPKTEAMIRQEENSVMYEHKRLQGEDGYHIYNYDNRKDMDLKMKQSVITNTFQLHNSTRRLKQYGLKYFTRIGVPRY